MGKEVMEVVCCVVNGLAYLLLLWLPSARFEQQNEFVAYLSRGDPVDDILIELKNSQRLTVSSR